MLSLPGVQEVLDLALGVVKAQQRENEQAFDALLGHDIQEKEADEAELEKEDENDDEGAGGRRTPRLLVSPEAMRLVNQAAEQRKRAKRLVQLRKWLTDDPDLAHLIDDCIGQQVRAAEKRQRVYTVGVAVASSVASLIAGWLLSAVSPVATLAHLLPR